MVKRFIYTACAFNNIEMKTLFLLLMTSLMLFSCESKDGDWDPMIWKSNDVSKINNSSFASSTCSF